MEIYCIYAYRFVVAMLLCKVTAELASNGNDQCWGSYIGKVTSY